jgi:multidrug resistance efflux pump
MEFIELVKVSQKEVENVHLTSNEVNEILGQVPKRIIRYGIATIAVILMVAFAFTFVFRYPDIIYGSFYIQSSNPPAFLLARASGKIQSLHVSDKEEVKEGQLLATIENATSYASYQKLKLVLKDTVSRTPHISALGELQSVYGNFEKSCNEIRSFEVLNYHEKKIKSLERQKNELIKQINLQENQVKASGMNTSLSVKMFERDSLLYAEHTIAAAT